MPSSSRRDGTFCCHMPIYQHITTLDRICSDYGHVPEHASIRRARQAEWRKVTVVLQIARASVRRGNCDRLRHGRFVTCYVDCGKSSLSFGSHVLTVCT